MKAYYSQLDLFDLCEKASVDVPVIRSFGKEKLIVEHKQVQSNSSLFSRFKQVALAIYNSYEWTDRQLLKAAKILYPFIGYRTNVKTSSNKVVEAMFVSEEDQNKLGLFGKSDQTYCIPIYYKMADREYYRRFIVLSDAHQLKSDYTDVYYFRDKPFIRYSYMSKAYLLGFAYLISSIKADFHRTADTRNRMDFSELELRDLIKGLISGPRSNNYNFYDYAMTNANLVKEWQSDTAETFKLAQKVYKRTGSNEEVIEWSGYRDFKRAIDYLQKFLDSNFRLVPITKNTNKHGRIRTRAIF